MQEVFKAYVCSKLLLIGGAHRDYLLRCCRCITFSPHLIFKFLLSIQGEKSLILEQAYVKFCLLATKYIDGFGSAIFENTVIGANFTTSTQQRRTKLKPKCIITMLVCLCLFVKCDGQSPKTRKPTRIKPTTIKPMTINHQFDRTNKIRDAPAAVEDIIIEDSNIINREELQLPKETNAIDQDQDEFRIPTRTPTKSPTKTPTKLKSPTKTPTKRPTKTPTKRPTKIPTKRPTKTPTKRPTKIPMKRPTKTPTKRPTKTPTKSPTKIPTSTPTYIPTTTHPTSSLTTPTITVIITTSATFPMETNSTTRLLRQLVLSDAFEKALKDTIWQLITQSGTLNTDQTLIEVKIISANLKSCLKKNAPRTVQVN